MNFNVLNSNTLNSAALNVVVAAISAVALTVSGAQASGERRAQPLVLSQAITTHAACTAAQHHYSILHTSAVQTDGPTALGIRLKLGFANANTIFAHAPISIHAIRNAQAHGEIHTSAAVVPNYLVVPPAVSARQVSLTSPYVNGYPTKRGLAKSGGINFAGYAFSPLMVIARPYEGLIRFDGYAIAANHIGKAAHTTVAIAGGAAEGVRRAITSSSGNIVAAAGTLNGVYNTAQGHTLGSIRLSHTLNVKINNVHYMEQTSSLSIQSSLDTITYRSAREPVSSSLLTLTTMLSEQVVLRRMFTQEGGAAFYCPPVDTDRRATPHNAFGGLAILSTPAGGVVLKPAQIVMPMVVAGAAAQPRVHRTGDTDPSIFALATTAVGVIRRTTTVVAASLPVASAPVTPERRAHPAAIVAATAVSGSPVTGNTVAQITPTATQTVALSGGEVSAIVMYTAHSGQVYTSGFAYGERRHMGAANYDLRIDARADAIANPYVRAQEERSMVVPSFGNKTTLHELIVSKEDRSMIA